jgi:ATP-binding cassette subfamily C protein PrsD
MSVTGETKSIASGDDVDVIAIKKSRRGFIAVGIASALINILYLTGSFFMLQVYDRVIPSKSIPTLVALSVLAVLLYFFQGVFDVARSRVLVRIAGVFDEVMSARVFRAVMNAPLRMGGETDSIQLQRDFDQVKGFLTGSGPGAFFDLPWMPLYIVICFMFHPVIGIAAIIGALLLVLITYFNNRSTQASAKEAHETSMRRNSFLNAAHRNAEVVQAMGMTGELERLWQKSNDAFREKSQANSDVANTYSAFAKIFRTLLQSAVLAIGAILVIEGKATGGIIIASSILTARALAPIDQAIANWRSFVAAGQSWKRLRTVLESVPVITEPTELPSPQRDLRVEAVSSGPPGGRHILVNNVTFAVPAGSAVGVIGPSGSGKSTLIRAIAGVWPIYRGWVRIDGAALDQWGENSRKRHIGYLPQDVELFSGTVAQNISRFDADMDVDSVIHAARMADVHELILRLPNGYDTQIGAGGSALSAGQRQRVALARALYKDPFLVILDEPNSNLDGEGEQALAQAIKAVRNRRGIVVIVAHRPSALEAVDLVLMMRDGKALGFGDKAEVLSRVLRPEGNQIRQEGAASLKIVGAVDRSE